MIPMVKKRRYNSGRSTGSDLQDFSTVLIGAGILLFLWLIAIAVQFIIAYWYVITPVILCLIYVWFKLPSKTPSMPIPSTKTIETIEDSTTNQGKKTVKTLETYQDKKPAGIIQALINRL